MVGRPDPMLGEVPVAFVLPTSGGGVDLATLEAACERELTPYKRPREIRVVDELPRSTLDKVAKAVLRERLRQEVEVDA
ncbi:hypothetical protein MF408_13540 [Nocardioides sp. TF02-7]|nr:hypothetical protein MF408_13540 [Nocardioides sp. TF02-7]